MTISGTLRMDGIDTPEKNGKCPLEKTRAAEATTFLLNTISAGKGRVSLYVVGLVGEDGGGFGRYRSQVKVGNAWLSELMIKEGFARENHGEPRKSWCTIP
jgi:endonuclease YncB( thermonuclease family)